MPKPTMQGCQNVVSECHGIQLRTPVAATGTRSTPVESRPSRGEGRGSTDAALNHASPSPYRTYRQPCNWDRVIASRSRPLTVSGGSITLWGALSVHRA